MLAADSTALFTTPIMGRTTSRWSIPIGSQSLGQSPRPAASATPTTALAEAVNGLFKTELIRQRGPWRTVEQVELATLEYVWWWNNGRLHGELGMRTPIEAETEYYAALESASPATAGQATG